MKKQQHKTRAKESIANITQVRKTSQMSRAHHGITFYQCTGL